MIKTSLYCLAIALALRFAFGQAFTPDKDLPWLQINTRKIPGDKFIHPERTQILTKYEPVVSNLSEPGKKQLWVISFNIF